MTTLFDFIKKELNTVEAGGKSLTVKTGQVALTNTFALALIQAEVTQNQAEKFAKKLVELISSDQFLRELSEEIREPGITETEEAFVERGKSTMKKLLDRHLA
ncbi:hypothetical protein [Polaromonas sp.]|uniref:hypothetical protein n=1 Tax=Polaromonas sp. TaxID=1869339 RepID=UPI003BACE62D